MLLSLSQPLCCKDDSNDDDALVAVIACCLLLHLLPHLNLHTSLLSHWWNKLKNCWVTLTFSAGCSQFLCICKLELCRNPADKIKNLWHLEFFDNQISTYFKNITHSDIEPKNLLLIIWLPRKFVPKNFIIPCCTNQCKLAISIQMYNTLVSDGQVVP